MKLEKDEIITLDNDKKYIVVDNISCNNEDYNLLLTVDKPIQILIVKQEIIANEINIIPVTGSEEAKKVLNIFTNKKIEELLN